MPKIGANLGGGPDGGSWPTHKAVRQEVAEEVTHARASSFAARFGWAILQHGIAAIPSALYHFQGRLGLYAQHVWFATYIFSYQWDTALPYPSIVKMAEQTGYTTAYLHRIKGSLVEKGYLRMVHRTNAAGGQDSNGYDFSGLLDAVRGLLQPTQPPLAATAPAQGAPGSAPLPDTADGTHTTVTTATPSTPRRGSLAVQARRDRVRGQKLDAGPINGAANKAGKGDDTEYALPSDIQYADPDDIQYISPPDDWYAGGSDAQYIRPGDVQYIEPDDNQFAGAGDPKSRRLATPRMQDPVTRNAHEEETEQIETKKKIDDSSQLSTIEIQRTNRRSCSPVLSFEVRTHQEDQQWVKEATRPAHPPYSPYIAQVITDFSNELQDSGHVIENVSQALRLWRDSGLDDREFVELLYEAKRRTRLGQSKGGARGLSNKMAYYFTCLRDLCAKLQDGG